MNFKKLTDKDEAFLEWLDQNYDEEAEQRFSDFLEQGTEHLSYTEPNTVFVAYKDEYKKVIQIDRKRFGHKGRWKVVFK